MFGLQATELDFVSESMRFKVSEWHVNDLWIPDHFLPHEAKEFALGPPLSLLTMASRTVMYYLACCRNDGFCTLFGAPSSLPWKKPKSSVLTNQAIREICLGI